MSAEEVPLPCFGRMSRTFQSAGNCENILEAANFSKNDRIMGEERVWIDGKSMNGNGRSLESVSI